MGTEEHLEAGGEEPLAEDPTSILSMFEGLDIPWEVPDCLRELTSAETGIDGAFSQHIITDERNITLTIYLESAETLLPSQTTLPGRLELEIRTAADEQIDTIKITQLSPESVQTIIDSITKSFNQVEEETPHGKVVTLSAPNSSYLLPAKLKHILETAGSNGAHFVTNLGVTPAEISERYEARLHVQPKKDHKTVSLERVKASSIRAAVLTNGFELGRALQINRFLVSGTKVSADVERLREGGKVIWVTSKGESDQIIQATEDIYIEISDPNISADAQLKLALFSAVLRGDIELDEMIICFKGGQNRINGFEITSPNSQLSWLTKDSITSLKRFITLHDEAAHTLERVLDIAIRFSRESNEGDEIGALFIIGDIDELEAELKQKYDNPFSGPEEGRSIFKARTRENMRVFSTIDGATVIRPNGIVDRSCTYVTSPSDGVEARENWGGRHRAGGAITLATDAIAIVLSQSTGAINVFWDGVSILEFQP